MRTTIYLTDEQVKGLAAYCAVERISRAEAVRRAVDLFLRQQKRDAMRAAFGAWKHKNLDGVEYQRQLRAEWNR